MDVFEVQIGDDVLIVKAHDEDDVIVRLIQSGRINWAGDVDPEAQSCDDNQGIPVRGHVDPHPYYSWVWHGDWSGTINIYRGDFDNAGVWNFSG